MVHVADKDILVLLQIIGFEIPVGAETDSVTFTITSTKVLKQLPFSHRTL